MTFTPPGGACCALHRQTSQRGAIYGYLVGVTLAMAAAAMLVATSANAQTAEQAGREPSHADAQVATRPLPTPQAATKYTPQDITRAFGFLDSNKNDKISLEEAASFRNVAKHFQAADTNKDQSLSRAEFESALNRRKSR